MPTPLPEEVRHFEFVPFGPLLKRAAAVVHHGGIGTTAMCLKAAVPQVAVPNLHINRDTATRLARCGAGEMVTPRGLCERMLSESLTRLLGSTEVRDRCRQVAESMQDVDAVSDTCDRMEKLPQSVVDNASAP